MLKRVGIPLLALCILMMLAPQAASSKVHVRVFAGVGPSYTYSVPYGYGYYRYPVYDYPSYYYYSTPYYYRSYAPYYYWGGHEWHRHHWR